VLLADIVLLLNKEKTNKFRWCHNY
jgi:hypothetical protein